MADEAIAVIPKNSREEVRVSLSTFKGHRLVDMRVYAENRDGNRVTTPKGVSMRLEALPALISALEAAARSDGHA